MNQAVLLLTYKVSLLYLFHVTFFQRWPSTKWFQNENGSRRMQNDPIIGVSERKNYVKQCVATDSKLLSIIAQMFWSLVNKILTMHFSDVVITIYHPLTNSYCLLFSGVGSIVPVGWKCSQGYQPGKFMKKWDHLVSASNKSTLVFRTPMDPTYVSKRVF